MRKVIIKKEAHVEPFNEPAHTLRILNKPLWQWHRDLLDPHTEDESVVDALEKIPPDTVEVFAYRDNLFFDQAFFKIFIEEARRRARPCRAAFRASDPAYLQQGLRALTTSIERRGDLYMLDMWYFPPGLSSATIPAQIEPLIVESEASELAYYRIPTYSPAGQGDVKWWVPKRIATPIDTWVHVFFTNIVFGAAKQAVSHRSDSSWRSMLERPFRSTQADVTHGENCEIDPSVTFSGRVVIGDNVTIGPGCVISECIIGDNVTLAHGNRFYMSVLSDNCFFPGGASATYTVFMENSTAGQSASLEMSVVGRNSYIGSGTVFSNTPLLGSTIDIRVDYEATPIEMPVLGGCVGHNCRIGSGLVVYPGKTIESDVVLFPSSTRRVIMSDISFEESDHHATLTDERHPRQYPRRRV